MIAGELEWVEERDIKSESATPLERYIWEDVVSAASLKEAKPLIIVEWYEMNGMKGLEMRRVED